MSIEAASSAGAQSEDYRNAEEWPVTIRPWSAGDLGLLERLLGETEAMQHLGGPESPEAIRQRHLRYLVMEPAEGGVYAVVFGTAARPVGWVGYWELVWRGEPVWECGWHILPEWQHAGVATAALEIMVEHVRSRGDHCHMHAFPAVDNGASNALCRKLGFALLGEVDIEYPIGCTMHSNDWVLDTSDTRPLG